MKDNDLLLNPLCLLHCIMQVIHDVKTQPEAVEFICEQVRLPFCCVLLGYQQIPPVTVVE